MKKKKKKAEQQAIKEVLHQVLLGKEKGEQIDVIEITKKIGGTVNYVSTVCKFAKEAGFLEFHSSGEYMIERIPKNYQDFKKGINEKLYEQRSRSQGMRSGPGKYGRAEAPSAIAHQVNIESLSKENFIEVLTIIFAELEQKKEIEEKYKKLLIYAKKLKEERDAFFSGIDEGME